MKSGFRVLILILAFTWIVCAGIADDSSQDSMINEFEKDDYIYVLNDDGTITIKEYTGTAKELMIPLELDGKTVSGIDSLSFKADNLEKVEIPREMKSIDGNPFDWCPNLKGIVVDKENAFFTAVDGILYTKDMKTIVSVPRGLGLVEFSIPDGIETISTGAFGNCKTLEKIDLPSSLKLIGNSAFNACDSLQSIIIPDGVKELHAAFSRCTKLSMCVLPEGLTTVGNLTFYSCSRLKELKLPSTVTSIGVGCFFASGIREIVLPEGVQTIPGDAFLRCALRKITIPRSVTSIDDTAFGEKRGEHHPDLVFVVEDGSYALSYAKEMNIQYEILDEDNSKNELSVTENIDNGISNIQAETIEQGELPSFVHYSVAETDVNISLPEEWYYADYSTGEGNQLCSALDWSIDQFHELLNDSNAFFLAATSNFDHTISCYIEPTEVLDFSTLTDAMLQSVSKVYYNKITAEGNKVQTYRVVNNRIPYVKVKYTDSESKFYSYRFVTVKNNKQYTIVMDVSDSYQASDEKLIDQIMDTFSFVQSSQDCYIDTLQMTVSIPTELSVLTEQERIALDASGKYQFFARNNDGSFAFHVDMISSDVGMKNMNLFSQDELHSFLDYLVNLFKEQYNATNASGSIEEINGITYLKLSFEIKITANTGRETAFVTVLNNKGFILAFDQSNIDNSFENGLVDETFIKSIISSIRYSDDMTDPANSYTGDVNKRFETYTINQPNITIKIPSKYNVFWRGMPADAFSLQYTGDKIEDWDKEFESNPFLMLSADADKGTKAINLHIGDTPDMPDIRDTDFVEIKRYIKSVEHAQAIRAGMDHYSYKIIKTNQYQFIVSLGRAINDNPEFQNTLSAFTFQHGHLIKLAFDSDTEIVEDEIESFNTMLLSLNIDNKEQRIVESTDWFTINDIDSYPVVVRDLTINVPAQYLYYSENIPKDDLCLNGADAHYSVLDQMLNAGNYQLLAFPFTNDSYLTVKCANSDMYTDFTYDHFEDIQNADFGMYSLIRNQRGVVLEDSDFIKTGSQDSPRGYYWIKYKVRNETYAIEQMFFSTVINGVEYTITLEKSTISDDDEMEITNMIMNSHN